jgi:hypothetical protein
MAFVNEKLTEKDKEFIALFEFHKPIGRTNELARLPENWATDREKGYFLICLGGQGYTFDEEHPPYYYRLIIDNAVVKIEARFRSKGDYNTGVKVEWRIESIDVPKSLNNLPSEVLLNIINDAFISYSNIHKNGHVESTSFDKVCMPIYLNDRGIKL